MKGIRTAVLLLACTSVAVAAAAVALTPAKTVARNNQPPPPMGRRTAAEVTQILDRMKSSNVRRTIEKLVSFGTRHTLSSQTDPKRGVGAARDYVFRAYQKVAATSHGRMTVEKQTFT